MTHTNNDFHADELVNAADATLTRAFEEFTDVVTLGEVTADGGMLFTTRKGSVFVKAVLTQKDKVWSIVYSGGSLKGRPGSVLVGTVDRFVSTLRPLEHNAFTPE